MAWVDGSTLIFLPRTSASPLQSCKASGDCLASLKIAPGSNQPSEQGSGSGGSWITLEPISNYQFSLCVQGGDCKPPTNSDYSDPSKESLPVGVVGPDRSGAYCNWIGGRDPTDAETTELGVLIGLLRLAPEFTGGVHCVVDSPRPRPLYGQTSPYYDPSTSLADMQIQVSKTNTFCQNGQAYETLDLVIPADHSIQSFNGGPGTTCQLTSSNRVVCSGPSGSSSHVAAPVPCTARDHVDCQPGSDLGTAGCSNNMHGEQGAFPNVEGYGLDSNGALVPTNGVPLPNGALGAHRLIARFDRHLIHGIMMVESAPGNNNQSNAGPMPAVCPVGFYPDNGLGGCASLGPSEAKCLDGFTFDASLRVCMSSHPNGNYPGCPSGQIFDPSTGICDPHTTILSSTQVVHNESIQVSLPDCTKKSACKLSAAACSPMKFNPATCSCY